MAPKLNGPSSYCVQFAISLDKTLTMMIFSIFMMMRICLQQSPASAGSYIITDASSLLKMQKLQAICHTAGDIYTYKNSSFPYFSWNHCEDQLWIYHYYQAYHVKETVDSSATELTLIGMECINAEKGLSSCIAGCCIMLLPLLQ